MLVVTSSSQNQGKAEGFEGFCLALCESNDISDTAELLIAIQGITESSVVVREATSFKSLLGKRTGEDCFECV
jgi:hypothetical protein